MPNIIIGKKVKASVAFFFSSELQGKNIKRGQKQNELYNLRCCFLEGFHLINIQTMFDQNFGDLVYNTWVIRSFTKEEHIWTIFLVRIGEGTYKVKHTDTHKPDNVKWPESF